MSIVSEITRINTNIASAYTACNTMGATMPASGSQNSANLATTISSIPAGTGGTNTLLYAFVDGSDLYYFSKLPTTAGEHYGASIASLPSGSYDYNYGYQILEYPIGVTPSSGLCDCYKLVNGVLQKIESVGSYYYVECVRYTRPTRLVTDGFITTNNISIQVYREDSTYDIKY